MSCPFCCLFPEQIIASDSECMVIRDAFPVTKGHTLILPRRHVASFFELTEKERSSLFRMLDSARRDLDREYSPNGYNIGVNDGPAAGQTVPHVHMHLIPRYNGDVDDPRGGVRWIFPAKAPYWN